MEAAAVAKKRKPGRPLKLASGISSRGAGPLLGSKDTTEVAQEPKIEEGTLPADVFSFFK